jgi:hypothetical protein
MGGRFFGMVMLIFTTLTMEGHAGLMKLKTATRNLPLNKEFANKQQITLAMRADLVDGLLYTQTEVDMMDPRVATVLLQKRLHRPKQGMPGAWRKKLTFPLASSLPTFAYRQLTKNNILIGTVSLSVLYLRYFNVTRIMSPPLLLLPSSRDKWRSPRKLHDEIKTPSIRSRGISMIYHFLSNANKWKKKKRLAKSI